MSDSKPRPQSVTPHPAGEQYPSSGDRRAGNTSPANDDVKIDASTVDALRFWLRLVALS